MSESLLSELTDQVWLVFAVFLRIAAAISLAPGYGESYVSARVRLIIALFLSVAIAPVLQPYLPAESLEARDLFFFAIKEVSFGIFIGLFARGIVYLLELAGTMISQTVSLSQMLGNATEPMPVMSHILTVTGLALIFSTTLDDQIVYAFAASYFVELPIWAEIWGYFAEKSSELLNFLFVNAVVLSSGFISLFFVYYLFIGFVNKAMPQFMVSFIGIPFVALYSIYFLQIHHELLLTVWRERALTILMMPFESAK
ncbi:flagellar biosynthetic protein FliR [Marivita sp. S2033]|uniref:flagellar biosynthetic protein FliR n=1 Tax=Marivita sp. S2033 TaxID=3373187 RepID=UPI003981C33E